MSAETFDVICIGAGTVGEAVAAGLAGSGLTVAVVEGELVGGECPHWGCIPSKALVRSSEVLAEAGRARLLAASRVDVEVDFARISRRAHEMAGNGDDSGAAAALVGHGAVLVRGEGRLVDGRTVTVGDRTLTAARGIVIGTGTSAAIPPIDGLDRVPYWTNRQAVIPDELPASMVVLGGGAIGAELAQAYARFGTSVIVVEALDRLLSAEEPEAGAILGDHFAGEGIEVRTSARSVRADTGGGMIRLHLESGDEVAGERLLVAVGRRPRLQSLDLEAAGIATTERGWIRVDERTLQAADGIWAGGDITGIGAFTHLSWYHGLVIARQLRGEAAVADHRAIPRVTFTDPEVASVGMSEAQAQSRLAAHRVVRGDVGTSTRGNLNGPPGGVVKLIADTERNVLVGALVVGPRAGEIIGELTLAIRAEVDIAVLVDTLHAFPTFARILDELFAELGS